MEREKLLTEDRLKDPKVKAAFNRVFVDVIAESNKAPQNCISDKSKYR
jgi:hypothetical protein